MADLTRERLAQMRAELEKLPEDKWAVPMARAEFAALLEMASRCQSDPVHLLDERDETRFYEQTGPHAPFRRWTSTWFPFVARVQKSPSDDHFIWNIQLVGAQPFESGKSDSLAAAFQAVAAAKQTALARLRESISP